MLWLNSVGPSSCPFWCIPSVRSCLASPNSLGVHLWGGMCAADANAVLDFEEFVAMMEGTFDALGPECGGKKVLHKPRTRRASSSAGKK